MHFSLVFACALALVLDAALPFDLRKTETRSPAANTESRVVKGNPALENQIPYQVGLALFGIHSWPYFFCGGSLISTEWILTAAHCFRDIKIINVNLGHVNRKIADVHCTVTIDYVIVHADFNDVSGVNDIALINIPPVEKTIRVQIVPLPLPNSINDTYLDEYAFVSGWGKTADSSELADNLQVAVMQVTSCKKFKESFESLESEWQMCANSDVGVTFCTGDSGGPLVSKSKGIQIGIASLRGAQSCEQRAASVFTRVGKYLDWIYFHTGIAN